MPEILSYVDDYIKLITGFFSVLILGKGLYSFWSSNNLERQFFSKEKKFLFEFLNLSMIFIFFPTSSFFSIYSKDSRIWTIINDFFIYFLLAFFITGIIITFTKLAHLFKSKHSVLISQNSILKFIFTNVRIKNKFWNRNVQLLLTLSFIFSAILVFGAINVDIIHQNADIKNKILMLCFLGLMEIFPIYLVIVWGRNIKFTTPVLVSIKMEDGQEYNNYYIYYPSNRKYLLIGKAFELDKCKEPILIKADKIISCTQVYK